ncbi:MAG: Transglycosylase SLT domain protein [Candidatus Izimaplasma bacterium HR2]|nr:MAG: Transglycosylase SLT domain protein [Candidatus Izimaplasma bacterium HR2]
MLVLVFNTSPIYGELIDEYDVTVDEVDLRDYKQIEIMPISHQYYLITKARKSSFSSHFLFAVIKLESSFNYKNISYNKSENGNILSYDRGYFQINNRYEHWYAELAELTQYDVFNPYNSIDMGIAGLEFYRRQAISLGYKSEYDILRYVLNSYNMGEGGFRNYIKRTGTMNRAYSNIILKTTKEYEEE